MKTLVSWKEKKRTWKNKLPRAQTTSVVIWARCGWFAAVGGVSQCVSGPRSGDGRWWRSCGGGRVWGRVSSSTVVGVTAEGSGVGAEFERTRKMECEKWNRKWPFSRKGGKGSIFQKWSFSTHSWSHFQVHFWKMEEKWKLKMSQKWPENGYCEQPYWNYH